MWLYENKSITFYRITLQVTGCVCGLSVIAIFKITILRCMYLPFHFGFGIWSKTRVFVKSSQIQLYHYGNLISCLYDIFILTLLGPVQDSWLYKKKVKYHSETEPFTIFQIALYSKYCSVRTFTSILHFCLVNTNDILVTFINNKEVT